MHSVNNALQRRECSVRDCEDVARELEAELSDSIRTALAPQDRRLVEACGNLDVTVLV